MSDLLRRYFVANTAPIFRVTYDKRLSRNGKFVPCRTGNSGGFFWRRWQVTWRRPYAKVWHWHPSARKWMTNPPQDAVYSKGSSSWISRLTLRRMVWGALSLAVVAFWALAIIGAVALVGTPQCPSIWEAAKSPLAVRR